MGARTYYKFAKWIVVITLSIVGSLILLLVVITRSSFITSVVVPYIGNSIGIKLKARRADVGFSKITLENVEAFDLKGIPIISFAKCAVKFDPISIIKGTYQIQTLELNKPKIFFQKLEDESSNLDMVIKAFSKAPTYPSKPPTKRAVQFEISKFELIDGELLAIIHQPGGRTLDIQLRNIDLIANRITDSKLDQSNIKIEFFAKHQEGDQVQYVGGFFKCEGGGQYGGRERLTLPENLHLVAWVTITNASQQLEELLGVESKLEIKSSTNRIEQIALTFAKDSITLGEVDLSGQVVPDGGGLRIDFKLKNLDHRCLNLFAMPLGAIFTNSLLEAFGTIDIDQKTTTLAVSTDLIVPKLKAIYRQVPLPMISTTAHIEGQINWKEKRARLAAFKMSVDQEHRPLLSIELTRAMNLFWDIQQQFTQLEAAAKGEAIPVDSVINFWLHDFNLDNWKMLFSSEFPSGIVSVSGAITNMLLGARISIGLRPTIKNLSFKSSDISFSDINIEGDLYATLERLQLIFLNINQLTAFIQSRPLLAFKGTGALDLNSKDMRLELSSTSPIVELINLVPYTQCKAQSGDLKIRGQFVNTTQKSSCDVTVMFDKFTGQIGNISLTNYLCNIELGCDLSKEQLNLRKLSLRPPKGSIDLTGLVSLHENKAQLRYNIAGLDIKLALPPVSELISPYTLNRLVVEGRGEASIKGTNYFVVNGSIIARELLISHPMLTNRFDPFMVGVELNAIYDGSVIKLATNTLILDRSQLAENTIKFTGLINVIHPNTQPSFLSLSAKSLDLNKWYEYLKNLKKATRSSDDKGSKRSQNVEAAIPNFTVDWDIERIYLKELEVSQFKGTASVKNAQLHLQIPSMYINGGAISLGFIADLKDPIKSMQAEWKIDSVPIGPVLSTFTEIALDKFNGQIYTQGHVRTSGKTNLLHSLIGSMSFNLTNIIINSIPPAFSLITKPLATEFQAPQLLDCMPQSFNANLQLSEGMVSLQNLSIVSPMVIAETQGRFNLAADPFKSVIKMPVTIALHSNIVGQVGLNNLKPSRWVGYMQIPTLLQIEGPLDSIKTSVDEKTLAQLYFQRFSEQLPSQAQQIIGVLTNITEAYKEGTNKLTPSTNKISPLQLIPQLFKH